MARIRSEPPRVAGTTIDVLQQRHAALHKKQIEAATELRNAQSRLEELKEAARAQYGTDNISELELKLHEMRSENEQKRASYQADLDRIENDLAQVEQNLAVQEAAGDEPTGQS
jgi:DNA repair exonuclease SbcCD ATPase subunit